MEHMDSTLAPKV